jgi:hypothetical protein
LITRPFFFPFNIFFLPSVIALLLLFLVRLAALFQHFLLNRFELSAGTVEYDHVLSTGVFLVIISVVDGMPSVPI